MYWIYCTNLNVSTSVFQGTQPKTTDMTCFLKNQDSEGVRLLRDLLSLIPASNTLKCKRKKMTILYTCNF
jgi:hypothetical protein